MNLAKRDGGGLPSVEKARAILAECGATGEVKKIRAIAQAIATMERGKEIALDAADIVLFADRRIGELTAEMEKVPDGKRRGSESRAGTQKTEALAEAGISKQRASECERVAGLDEAEVRQYTDAKRKAKEPASTREAAKLAKLPKPERKKVLATLGDVPSVSKAIHDATPVPAHRPVKPTQESAADSEASDWNGQSFLADVQLQLDELRDEWLRHEPNAKPLVLQLRLSASLMEKQDARNG